MSRHIEEAATQLHIASIGRQLIAHEHLNFRTASGDRGVNIGT
jgi:hypothetical protein